MFENLKELLALLVPDRDQDEVTENLDVSLLMQQIRHGVLDIVRLSAWLEGLLTSHCAAGVLRDQGKYGEAEQMYRQVVAVRERVLGKEHPDTLTSMNNRG